MSDLWRLPGQRRILRLCADSLRAAENLVVLGPHLRLQTLEPLLGRELMASSPLEWRFLPEPQASDLRSDPRRLLHEYFQVQEPSQQEIAPWDKLAGSALVVTWIRAESWPAWWVFAEAWAQHAQALQAMGRPLLALLVEPELVKARPPRSQPRLRIIEVQERLSAIDIRTLVDEQLSDIQEPTWERELRLELCAELSEGEPTRALELSGCTLGEILSLTRIPTSDFAFTVWRAQVRALFPIIEVWRRSLACNARPCLKDRDPMHMSPGEILHALRATPRVPPSVLGSADALAELRNALAHVHPVSLELIRHPALKRLQRGAVLGN